MSFAIRELALPEDVDALYSTDNGRSRLENLGKLNVLIGPNNCGKSRLLRMLFGNDRLNYVSTNVKNETFRRNRDDLMQLIRQSINNANERDSALDTLNKWRLNTRNSSGTISPVSVPDKRVDIENLVSSFAVIFQELEQIPPRKTSTRALRELYIEWQRLLRLEKEESPHQFIRVYIPSLRGMRPVSDDRSLYLNRTKKDYFASDNSSSFVGILDSKKTKQLILTGLELYEYARKHLLGSWEDREKFREFEDFLSEYFFESQRVTLIPRLEDDVLHIKIGEQNELPVHQLGDGIAQVAILALPIFLFRDEHLLFYIEEPELFLHPGYQRILAELFLNDDIGNHQVFIATHSSVFLDITLEQQHVSVYRVSRNNLSDDSSAGGKPFSVTLTTNDDWWGASVCADSPFSYFWTVS